MAGVAITTPNKQRHINIKNWKKNGSKRQRIELSAIIQEETSDSGTKAHRNKHFIKK
jgi:hypothetical protein